MPTSVERQLVARRIGLALIALGAVWHATRFDFFCDDAFIALRYAQNLLKHHELAYNPGERVEGFTSPLWVLLVALGGLGKVSLVSVARALGGAACVASVAATAALWDELEPDAPKLSVLLPAALLAVSAPFAAWSLSGLETPLFVCSYTWTLALLARAVRVQSVQSFFWLGLCGALATLCRPEALVLLVLSKCVVLLCVFHPFGYVEAPRSERAWQKLLAWWLPGLVLVGGYELFRLSYYGYPLPNTFYVKTSGDLWQHGADYLRLAAQEHGALWVAALALSTPAVFLLPVSAREQWLSERGSLLARAVAVVGMVVLLVYSARVGGDFLDLYRFIAPLLPAAYCLVVGALHRSWRRFAKPARIPLLLAAAALLAASLASRRQMTEQALTLDAVSRRALGLEPLGWTSLYARRWAGIGRFLARIGQPADTMATGAAGAIPFYSELPNLDLFGLNDAQIAHDGRVVSNRPGHQRFASTEYLFAKRPTFILLYPESTPNWQRPLENDSFWTDNGYVTAEMHVDASLCDCGDGFYHQFLIRRDRADSLRGAEGLRVAPASRF